VGKDGQVFSRPQAKKPTELLYVDKAGVPIRYQDV